MIKIFLIIILTLTFIFNDVLAQTWLVPERKHHSKRYRKYKKKIYNHDKNFTRVRTVKNFYRDMSDIRTDSSFNELKREVRQAALNFELRYPIERRERRVIPANTRERRTSNICNCP